MSEPIPRYIYIYNIWSDLLMRPVTSTAVNYATTVLPRQFILWLCFLLENRFVYILEQWLYHEFIVSDSELAKFRCQLCPKGFKHPTSLTLHKDSHAGKTQCPVCHRSFSRSYDMRSHLQRIHQGKQLTIKEIRYKNTSDNLGPKQFTQTHNI